MPPRYRDPADDPQGALPGILGPTPTSPPPEAIPAPVEPAHDAPVVEASREDAQAPEPRPAGPTIQGPRGFIRIGYSDAAKLAMVQREVRDRGADRVVLFAPDRHNPGWTEADLGVPVQHVSWSEAIMYRTYYPLLRELNARSLIVVSEYMRTQNRHELTYNCLRHYTNLTPHTLVFQRFPCIDTFADFGVLFDLVTRSRWKRTPVADLPFAEADIAVADDDAQGSAFLPTFTAEPVAATPEAQARYARDKAAIIAGIDGRDPHIIPRTLLLSAGKAKLAHPAVTSGGALVGRNNRFKLPGLVTYDTAARGPGEGFPAAPTRAGADRGRGVATPRHRPRHRAPVQAGDGHRGAVLALAVEPRVGDGGAVNRSPCSTPNTRSTTPTASCSTRGRTSTPSTSPPRPWPS